MPPSSLARASKHTSSSRPSHPRPGAGARGLAAALVAATLTLSAGTGKAAPALKVPAAAQAPAPFTDLLSVAVDNPAQLDYVTFTVQPKPGSVTRPVFVRYSAAYLRRKNDLDPLTGALTVPVFGLYSNYDNTVTIRSVFLDGSSETHTSVVTTPNYRGDLHKHPEIVQTRTTDTSLSYDFILLKNFESANDPLIIDTDGEIRWHGNVGLTNASCILYNNSIYAPLATGVIREDFDGTTTVIGDYAAQGVTGWNHNFDFGRDGIITQVDTAALTESIEMEIDPVTGNVLHTWNLAQIIGDAMKAGGDDPTQFVKAAPDDWFHNNATTYRPSDNTLLVSSRENFVIALDYDTQAIKWILGDTSKYWYQFPSLRKYALNLGPHTKAPIGQHAVSIVRDRLLLFDDGFGSQNQPYPGKGRTYSAPRKYLIDTAANTATETWNYTNDKMIDSPVCSSVYEDEPKNFLIDYATGGPFLFAELIGLNADGAKVFDYKYPEKLTCGSGWNAAPAHLENMVFN